MAGSVCKSIYQTERGCGEYYGQPWWMAMSNDGDEGAVQARIEKSNSDWVADDISISKLGNCAQSSDFQSGDNKHPIVFIHWNFSHRMHRTAPVLIIRISDY
jgi:hypothetical protein